jgi:hypothetical protein
VARRDGTQDERPELTREEAVARMKKRIEEDAASPRPVRSRRFRIGGFWIAFIATPVLVVTITAVAFAAVNNNILNFPAFLIPFVLLVTSVIAAIAYGVKGRGEITGGIISGIVLLIVGLGITCFIGFINL